MACGCKKKNNPVTTQQTPQVTSVPLPENTTSDQVIKISAVLKEMETKSGN